MEPDNIDEINRLAEEAKKVWNASADGYNQWDTLDLKEKLTLILTQM